MSIKSNRDGKAEDRKASEQGYEREEQEYMYIYVILLGLSKMDWTSKVNAMPISYLVLMSESITLTRVSE